ncbi:MAG: tetratricopeptide repeat protein [Phycisphaerae bacterium]|nr:tetratricopeptide repeat protein [Phycisphaerae bacterium]
MAGYNAAGLDSASLYANLLNVRGAALFGQQKYEEAESELLEGYSTLSADFADEHTSVQSVLKNLVGLYEAWGKPEQAETWRARLPESPEPATTQPAEPQ